MSGLKIYKEVSLPSTLETNSIYLISTADPEHVDVYVTGNTSGVVKRIFNKNDIDDIVSDALSGFTPESAITYGGNIDLNITPSGPEKLNTLFIVLNDYLTYKANDTLLKISNTEPYFVKLNSASSGGGSTPGEFIVIDWDPYNEDLVDIQPVAANSSTSYSNGTMSAVTSPSLVAELKDIGYPQSPEIILTQGSNGSPLNLNITPSSSDISKVFTIEDFSSLNIQPLDVFPYDGNPHGVRFEFLIIQLEENETMSSLTIQDMIDKGLNIGGIIRNLYQNESNAYTEAEVNITANGGSVFNVPIAPYGNYNRLNLNIVNNELFIGVNGDQINLIDYGFDANKRFGAIVLVTADANSFDVATPFNIALSAVSSPPALNCEIPTILDISVHKDEKLYFIFSDLHISDNPTNAMQLVVAESSGFLVYAPVINGEGDLYPISPEHVDSNGYINYKFNGTEFSLKNNNTLAYDIIATFPSNLFNYFTIQETDSSIFYEAISKTSWSFTINSMQKSGLVDGILPPNAVDGSTIRVTNDGLFDNVELKTGDIVTPYSNKTKLLLHRITQPTPPTPPTPPTIVSSDVTTAGTNAVSGDAVVNYVPTQISSFMSNMSNYNKMLWDGNTLQPKLSSDSNNMVQTRSDGLWAGIDTNYVFSNINEKTELYNSSYISLDMINNNVFYINTSGSSCSLYIYNLVAGPSNVSRTYTFIIENTYSISWPSNFKWLDETPPDLELGKVLVVTGIYTPNAGSYIFCTYNYFIKE